MRDLIEAVTESIVAEIDDADTWKIELYDPLWRNPKKGKVLNVYSGRAIPGVPLWTGGTMDLVEVVCEYGEPATEQARNLERDEQAELAAEDIADALRDWALEHQSGFSPAHKMDWTGTEYVPNLPRQLLVRYCRVTFQFEVAKTYG